jgi:hypothetical protein
MLLLLTHGPYNARQGPWAAQGTAAGSGEVCRGGRKCLHRPPPVSADSGPYAARHPFPLNLVTARYTVPFGCSPAKAFETDTAAARVITSTGPERPYNTLKGIADLFERRLGVRFGLYSRQVMAMASKVAAPVQVRHLDAWCCSKTRSEVCRAARVFRACPDRCPHPTPPCHACRRPAAARAPSRRWRCAHKLQW